MTEYRVVSATTHNMNALLENSEIGCAVGLLYLFIQYSYERPEANKMCIYINNQSADGLLDN